MAELESRSPVTGEDLGTVPAASEADVLAAVEQAALVQPLWAAVPPRARARTSAARRRRCSTSSTGWRS